MTDNKNTLLWVGSIMNSFQWVMALCDILSNWGEINLVLIPLALWPLIFYSHYISFRTNVNCVIWWISCRRGSRRRHFHAQGICLLHLSKIPANERRYIYEAFSQWLSPCSNIKTDCTLGLYPWSRFYLNRTSLIQLRQLKALPSHLTQIA